MKEINFNRTKAPYRRDQVVFRAKIISAAPDGGRFKSDVIDINGNGQVDGMDFKSNGCRRREVLEPVIHSGTDANGRQCGLHVLASIAQETGQRYFDQEQLSNWSTYKETISFGDGGSGASLHDWKNLNEVGVGVVPEYNYRPVNVAIDLKRREFVVYDPSK
jgi:hypothetical protein